MRSQLLLCAEQLAIRHNGASLPATAPPSHLDDSVPSAPPDDETLQPSAPSVIDTFQSAECVICMERKVRIICMERNHTICINNLQ